MNNYESALTPLQINEKLLIGLKKHLLFASDTTLEKRKRLLSLNNIEEVVQYVIENLNDCIPSEERMIYERFFLHLYKMVVIAKTSIHTSPIKFSDEIGFINVFLKTLRM